LQCYFLLPVSTIQVLNRCLTSFLQSISSVGQLLRLRDKPHCDLIDLLLSTRTAFVLVSRSFKKILTSFCKWTQTHGWGRMTKNWSLFVPDVLRKIFTREDGWDGIEVIEDEWRYREIRRIIMSQELRGRREGDKWSIATFHIFKCRQAFNSVNLPLSSRTVIQKWFGMLVNHAQFEIFCSFVSVAWLLSLTLVVPYQCQCLQSGLSPFLTFKFIIALVRTVILLFPTMRRELCRCLSDINRRRFVGGGSGNLKIRYFFLEVVGCDHWEENVTLPPLTMNICELPLGSRNAGDLYA